MNKSTSFDVKNILWHSFKALACLLQLCLLHRIAERAVQDLLFELLELPSIGYALIPFLVDVALYIALWWYYDHIDDFSFNRFCEAETANTPRLLRDSGFVWGHILSVLGATPLLTMALRAPLAYTSLTEGACTAIALTASLGFTTTASLLRILHLGHIWSEQKFLRSPKEKKHGLIGRILYALIYFGALAALIYCGIAVFFPIFGTLLRALVKLLWIPFLVLLGFLAALEIIRYIRRILERRRFLRRLESLRDRGEISFTLYGHPYLSLFGCFFPFGILLSHRPKYDPKGKTDIVYRIAIANCHRRRLTVVLCEHQIFQFMYTINIRIMRAVRGGLGMMGTGGRRVANTLSLPGFSWFVSHSFSFPDPPSTEPSKEVEKRILLVDPAPYVLCLRGTRRGEFIPLDNASEVFGYTVYGKNSFLNWLERI